MKRSTVFLVLLTTLMLLAIMLLWPRPARSLISSHQCNFCHDIHGAPGFTLLKETQVETLCMTCHGPGGISTLKADVHQNAVRSDFSFRFSCGDCHDPHDNLRNWLYGTPIAVGTNIELVGTKLDATGFARVVIPNTLPPVVREAVFESRGTGVGQPLRHSFADSDNDMNGYYDGICETCHTLTGHHRNNAPDTRHHTGDTCTRCHAHTDYFLP